MRPGRDSDPLPPSSAEVKNRVELYLYSTRPVGRPRQRRQEDVMEDLKRLKIKNWKEAAKDRRTWRDMGVKAKNHKGVF